MTTPLTYNIEQAAERLGPICTADWLRKHAKDLPHVRSGKGTGRAGRIGFTEGHLAEILTLLEQRPESMPAPTEPGEFRSVTSRRSA